MFDYFITEGEIADKMFNLDLEGERISFTIDGIDESVQDWFCQRFEDHLKRTAERAAKRAEKELQIKLQTALGLLG